MTLPLKSSFCPERIEHATFQIRVLPWLFITCPWIKSDLCSNDLCYCCSVTQSLSRVWLCIPMDCSTPGSPALHRLLELAQTHVHWVDDAIQPSHPLLSPSPSAFSPSQHQGHFQWVSSLHQVAKGLKRQLQHSPSKECSGLISFRIDCFDLLPVLGMLRSLLQHHTSKASILQRSAFFMAQLSHPYMTTGKTKALSIWTFVSQVMSLPFNMLSRLVIALLPRSKHLLISWLESPFAVILEPKKIKSATVYIFSSSICHEVMGLYTMILVF